MSIARHRNTTAQRGFTQAENALLFDPTLSAGALRLYLALKHYAWRGDGTIPKQAEVADSIGVSERALRDHYKELEAHRLVTVERKARGNVVVIEDVTPAEIADVGSADSAGQQRQISPLHREEDRKTSGETGVSPASAAVKQQIDELFDAFQADGMIAPTVKSQRASYMKQVRECHAAGWTPETVRSLAAAYRRHPTLKDTMLTIFALAKWAGQLEQTGEDQGARLRRRMAERGIV